MAIFKAGHGFEFICFLLETKWGVPVFCFWCGSFIAWVLSGGWITFVLGAIFAPILVLLSCIAILFCCSYIGTGGPADWDEFIEIKDEEIRKTYRGKRIPFAIVYEEYMAQRINFKKDVYEVLLRRNDLFDFCFTFKYSVKWFIGTLLKQGVDHSASMDNDEVAHVYDRGNDFYNWFLGRTMVYTSGIFEEQGETLETGQVRKLDSVCNTVHMKPGQQHLDIGCGWGTLLRHASKEFGTHSTGVTLSKQQKKWHEQECKKEGVKNADSLVLDYRSLPTEKKYDCITCLEMAEHVGIKNFQTFLLQVKDLLKDDGLFYLQIAGLRRAWQYEDLVWGIFMGTYIFPAADASCPLGWVTTQLERAGFEVHRVENCGVHYSLTIKKWYDNWMSNEKKVVAKYGQYWFRMWAIFLSWSAIIAAQGSSTVFMITCNKNHANDKMSVNNGKSLFSRMDTYVGRPTLSTQR